METRDFRLTIQRDDTDPDEPVWLIAVTFRPEFLQTIMAGGDAIAIRDSGGLLWFSGVPDDTGVLSDIWVHDGSPLDRLRNCSVHIVPL